ncbi:hypothetical protein BCR44DRAFT_1437994 [Catenaria anguillulae PL171]|uniref:Uncharacterized protein n=1 Tax=Catenaria anguillulae PL171 TaxID=765915 RepID=A0A1Y2HFU8_9FUNG|nr:hypothetical protein BCR44DRAFT_1454187 [Catenaria anguillulae PL171]ORZ30003.1 hypothetical protein BCR44DRAFT_1446740 [Catenaria anguillulae PL171]ORZ33457.1 hypothetical protein BCR44DRAFT_1437994 [Catenaria anguillulae PL171]
MPASTQCGDAQPGDSRLAPPGPSPSICHTSPDHALHGSRQCNASCSHPHVPPPGICQTRVCMVCTYLQCNVRMRDGQARRSERAVESLGQRSTRVRQAQGMGGPLQAETVRQRQGGRPGRHLEAQTAARKAARKGT